MRYRELSELQQRFAGRQRLDKSDAEELRRALLSDDGKISRKEANFLVKLCEQRQRVEMAAGRAPGRRQA